jgi:hypothetical protein
MIQNNLEFDIDEINTFEDLFYAIQQEYFDKQGLGINGCK